MSDLLKHGNTLEPLVSVICAGYNHGRIIRQALDGFVIQKMGFPLELLVHDDASMDDTAEIICEYTQKYPELIKPTTQTENQYSKGVKITSTFLYPKARGKYMALCEGDDYWTDENKLQKQWDFLESHLEYTLCGYNSKRYYMKQGAFEIEDPVLEEGEVSAKDLLLEPHHQGMTISSLLFRKDYALDRPKLFSICPVNDYSLRAYCFSQGKIYYVKETMSVSYFVNRRRYKKHRKRYLALMDDYPRVKNNLYFRKQFRRFRYSRWMNYNLPGMYKGAKNISGIRKKGE